MAKTIDSSPLSRLAHQTLADAKEKAQEPALQRRRVKRVLAHQTLWINPCTEGVQQESQAAVLCDMSGYGLGMIWPRTMPHGQLFTTPIKESNCDLLYRVVQCRKCGDAYRIGAELVCTLPRTASPSSPHDQDRIRDAILT